MLFCHYYFNVAVLMIYSLFSLIAVFWTTTYTFIISCMTRTDECHQPVFGLKRPGACAVLHGLSSKCGESLAPAAGHAAISQTRGLRLRFVRGQRLLRNNSLTGPKTDDQDCGLDLYGTLKIFDFNLSKCLGEVELMQQLEKKNSRILKLSLSSWYGNGHWFWWHTLRKKSDTLTPEMQEWSSFHGEMDIDGPDMHLLQGEICSKKQGHVTIEYRIFHCKQ